MRISTKTRYGMRLMIDIAQNQDGSCVPMRSVAERQDLSKKYLEQVAAPLVSAGLLVVTHGPKGGYSLGRPADAITLEEIVNASEEGLELVACTVDPSECDRAGDCASRQVWGGMQDAINAYLGERTLADII